MQDEDRNGNPESDPRGGPVSQHIRQLLRKLIEAPAEQQPSEPRPAAVPAQSDPPAPSPADDA
jgi:hypothetical protein